MLVHMHDLSYWYSFDPFLRFKNRCNRSKFDFHDLRAVMDRFKLPNGELYCRLENTNGWEEWPSRPLQAGESFKIVFKLPAREYLSIVDYLDLRLLRHIVTLGGQVLVLIVDGGRQSSLSDMAKAEECTRNFIRRILGRGPEVISLSKVIVREAHDFIKFLFVGYIPFFATHLSDRERVPEKNIARVSFFTFPLILRALEYSLPGGDAVVVVQWRDRLKKWKEFSGLMKVGAPKLRVTDFIVGESFPDYEGKKLPTASQPKNLLFTMTEPSAEVSNKLKTMNEKEGETEYVIPDEYLVNLAQNLFGLDLSQRNPNELRDEFSKEFKRVQRSLIRPVFRK